MVPKEYIIGLLIGILGIIGISNLALLCVLQPFGMDVIIPVLVIGLIELYIAFLVVNTIWESIKHMK